MSAVRAYCPACDAVQECVPQYPHSLSTGPPGGDQFKNSLHRCGACGLVFVHPEPSPTVARSFYTPTYGPYGPGPDPKQTQRKFRVARWRLAGWNRNRPSLSERLKRLAAASLEFLLGRKVPYSMAIPLFLPKQAKILEIGYGSGYWLLAMKSLHYENLWGVDLEASKQPAVAAAGIHTLAGDILDIELPTGFFDLIRLEHAFEHFCAPRKCLSQIHAWLKPRGLLVVNMPNLASLSQRVFGRAWASLNPPYHFYHWSPRTFARLGQGVGFKLLAGRTLPVWAVFAESFRQRIPQGWPGKLAPVLANPIPALAFSPLYAVLCHLLDQGDYFSAVLQKEVQ